MHPEACTWDPLIKKGPKVIVDWHNTLELNDQVPPTHDKALDALLEKADVYMLSFCGKDRKPQALTNMVKMSIWTPSTYFEEENTSGRIGRAVFQVIPPQLGWCSGGEQSRARYRRSQEQGEVPCLQKQTIATGTSRLEDRDKVYSGGLH